MTDPGGTRVAVDVGGTFIDFVVVHSDSGEVSVDKQPTVPDDLPPAVMEGLSRLPVALEHVSRLFHGSTLALNAIVQERGAPVGLITTKGFRDVLELGRGGRTDIYDWAFTPPDPLIPRYRRAEVPERLAPDGSEVAPLDLDALDDQVDVLVDSGVEAIAIAFLHSYANPAHERRAAARIRDRHPSLWVTVSSDVATEWREFERTSTATLNAFVQPIFGRYIGDLGKRLRDAGYAHPIAVMQSNGGVMDAERAAMLPVRTVMSGPSGGAIAGRYLAQALDLPDLICADVGGTTFDVTLIQGGEVLERTETSIGGRPILAPSIDIASIGAGGGSIAWIDQTGALNVGPRSAGARPGPVAFGLGGTEATVTDCQLVLGRLPHGLLGGRMSLDLDAARQAIRSQIAEPLDLTLEEAALGTLTIAEMNMSRAIREVTVERGLDPRSFALLAYGGGGGLFATGIAEELEIPRIVVPRGAATFSAWGILASDYREDRSLTRVMALEADNVESIGQIFGTLGEQVIEDLAGHGFPADGVAVTYQLQLRFDGQEHTIPVPVDHASLAVAGGFVSQARERFVAAHRQHYGHGDANGPIEVVTMRCRGVGSVERPKWPVWSVIEHAAPGARRPVVWTHGTQVDTPVYERELLGLGQVIAGPAVIEEWSTTILVPPRWSATVDAIGNLVMEQT